MINFSSSFKQALSSCRVCRVVAGIAFVAAGVVLGVPIETTIDAAAVALCGRALWGSTGASA